MQLAINGSDLSWDAVEASLHGPVRVRVSARAMQNVARSRTVVDRQFRSDKPVYGINTGFGSFARTRISSHDLFRLQTNLVLSHSSGVGEPFPPHISRLILLLKLFTLTKGCSGVRPELITTLARMINEDCLPVIPSQGSVGASGDLAPLAHLASALLGHGEVVLAGKRMKASAGLKRIGLKPCTLHPKEGLALLNGTQAMTAVAAAAILLAREVIASADMAGALTIEGLFGSVVPFDSRFHDVRPHPGAVLCASVLRKLLAGSNVVKSHKDCLRVQDPYALRCIPSVHGAARDAYLSAMATVGREINSVTDNPLVFENDILSGGNFHGAPVALAMDCLAIAMTTLGSISERRIEQMTNPKCAELPVSGLASEPGLNSGYMLPHVTAASLVSENKTLSHPASVDTIPTWAGQEDHVSMGMWAARKALQVASNTAFVVGIELLAAAQATDLHPVRYSLGRGTKIVYREIRSRVKKLLADRFLAPELSLMHKTVCDGNIRRAVEKVVGTII